MSRPEESVERVELGATYEDSATGYQGTATARNEILGGAVSVKMERLDTNGKVEELWFAESRLREVNAPQTGVGFG